MVVEYTAKVTKENDYYLIRFPDVSNAFTFGHSVEEAITNAKDVLGLALYDATKLPAKKNIGDIQLNQGEMLVTISVDLDEYAKFMQNRIRYTREKKGLSPADVASLFGGEEEQIIEWEKNPPAPWLQNLIIDEIEAFG